MEITILSKSTCEIIKNIHKKVLTQTGGYGILTER